MHHLKTAALLWLISALLFFSLFQMAHRNSDSTRSIHPSASGNSPYFNSFSLFRLWFILSGLDSAIPISDRRSALYEKMARDLDEKGPMFLKHGQTSQSLSLSDLFTVKDGSVAPVLKVKLIFLVNWLIECLWVLEILAKLSWMLLFVGSRSSCSC